MDTEQELWFEPEHWFDKALRWSFAVLEPVCWMILVCVIFYGEAHAHVWYPTDCCQEQDCYSIDVTKGRIEIIPGIGYYIVRSGETIQFGDNRIREFPPEAASYPGDLDHFHRCSGDGGAPTARTICLFPPRGAF